LTTDGTPNQVSMVGALARSLLPPDEPTEVWLVDQGYTQHVVLTPASCGRGRPRLASDRGLTTSAKPELNSCERVVGACRLHQGQVARLRTCACRLGCANGVDRSTDARWSCALLDQVADLPVARPSGHAGVLVDRSRASRPP